MRALNNYIPLLLLFYFFNINSENLKDDYAIVIHGGAGWFSNLPEDEVEGIKKGLKQALDKGYEILAQDGSSIDAVEEAIKILEDNPLFNAGRGAVYNAEGVQELDASIMQSNDHNAGAITGVTTVKNPISLARHVMENTKHVMFSGEGAEIIAKEAQLDLVDPSYFYSEKNLKRLKKQQSKDDKLGTVGVVAVDKKGIIVAGTSTGGMTNKLKGRIGDSPVIGAGTWATKGCGVSGTGHGEFFIRYNVAKEICTRVLSGGLSVSDAANSVISELKLLGADAGVIVIDQYGSAAMIYNTPAMARAYKNSNGDEEVSIYD
jgi:beta-aspartyl-peptidase (threonine type)